MFAEIFPQWKTNDNEQSLGCFDPCRIEFILGNMKTYFLMSILSLIHFLILTCCWNLPAWRTMARLSYANEYNGSWWPGGACRQAINSHNIDQMLPEYSSLTTLTVISTRFYILAYTKPCLLVHMRDHQNDATKSLQCDYSDIHIDMQCWQYLLLVNLSIWNHQSSNKEFGGRSIYLGHSKVITSHSLLWDVVTYPCTRYLIPQQ